MLINDNCLSQDVYSHLLSFRDFGRIRFELENILLMNSKIFNFKFSDLDEFNLNTNFNALSKKENSMVILQQNMQGMNNFSKFDNFSLFLDELQCNIDIIVLTETWINDENEKYYKIPGFNKVNSSRVDSRGGGLMIFFHSRYEIDVIDVDNSRFSFQFIHIRIKLSHAEHLHVRAVYYPPDTNMLARMKNS